MRRWTVAFLAMLTTAATAGESGIAGRQAAVAAPAFAAASVRPTDAAGDAIDVTAGRVTAHGVRLVTCISWAYSTQRSQIVPSNQQVAALLDSQRYDIAATSETPVPIASVRGMLQSLLAERFKLAMHREMREAQSFALVVDKGGPKFRESPDDGDSVERMASRLTRQWSHTPMPVFADKLSDAMQMVVRDETGLTGKYELALDFTPFVPATGERPDIGGVMVTAVQEQLGLRLVPRRTAVEFIVVDRLESPSPN